MAPVLQCPDCGSKHPLGEVPESGAFPCKGCGRVLKVPERASQSAGPDAAPTRVEPAPAPVPNVAPEPSATAVMPAVDTSARRDPVVPAPARPIDDRKPLGKVPIWMRFLLWLVAIPLGFIIVFIVARTFGVFTSSQLSDVFLASDTDRFWPVARVLPFVAFVTAVIVQAGVYAIARLRGNRSR